MKLNVLSVRFIGGTYGRIIGRAMVDLFGFHSTGGSVRETKVSILNRTTVRAFFLLLWCSFISGDYSLYEPSAKFNLPTSSLLFRGRQSQTEKYKRLRFHSSLAIRIFLRLKLVRKCIKSSFNASVF